MATAASIISLTVHGTKQIYAFHDISCPQRGVGGTRLRLITVNLVTLLHYVHTKLSTMQKFA